MPEGIFKRAKCWMQWMRGLDELTVSADESKGSKLKLWNPGVPPKSDQNLRGFSAMLSVFRRVSCPEGLKVGW